MAYRLGGAYVEIRAQSDRLKNDLRDAKTETDKTTATMAQYAKRFAVAAAGAFTINEIVGFTKDLFDAGKQMAATEKAFQEITGSASATKAEFAFLRTLADATGQNFYALTDAYKGFLAASQKTNLEGQKTKDVFSAITKAAATLGLSTDQTSGALYAVQQMMSKGTVQAEELRGQLGERLPGAFNLMAEALGVTTQELNKMLDNGEVLSAEALPKLAEVLDQRYSGAVSEATAASNKLAEAWHDFKLTLGDGVFMDVATGSINVMTAAIKAMNGALKEPDTVGNIKLQTSMLQQEIDMAKDLMGFAGDVEALKKRKELLELYASDIANLPRIAELSLEQQQGALRASAAAAKAEAERELEEAREASLSVELTWTNAWQNIDKASMEGVEAAIKRHNYWAERQKAKTAEYVAAGEAMGKDLWLSFAEEAESAGERTAAMLDDLEENVWRASFIGGVDRGLQELTDSMTQWGDRSRQITLDTFEGMRDTSSDIFFDALTGDLQSVGDYADAVWKAIARSFANMAADMVTEYAASGLKSLLKGEGDNSLVGGIIGAAGGIWDAVDWLSSDVLGLWQTGAWMVNQDQIAQLHAGEMVIPSNEADQVRALIEASGAGEGWGGSPGEGFAGNALGMGMLGGAAKGMGLAAVAGLANSASFGDLMGLMGKTGVVGGFTGIAGTGLASALGLGNSTAADMGKIAGAVAAASLGLAGPAAALAGTLGAFGFDALADAMDARSNEAMRDSFENAFGYFAGRAAVESALNDMGLADLDAARDSVADFAMADLDIGQGNATGVDMGGWGGWGGLGIGNPGSYGGDGGGGSGGNAGGAGPGGHGGHGGGAEGNWARGGWAMGPLTGYPATLHGTEYVLNADQIKVIRELALGSGRASGVGGMTITVPVTIDGKTIARAVAKAGPNDAQFVNSMRRIRG